MFSDTHILMILFTSYVITNFSTRHTQLINCRVFDTNNFERTTQNRGEKVRKRWREREGEIERRTSAFWDDSQAVHLLSLGCGSPAAVFRRVLYATKAGEN